MIVRQPRDWSCDPALEIIQAKAEKHMATCPCGAQIADGKTMCEACAAMKKGGKKYSKVKRRKQSQIQYSKDKQNRAKDPA